MAAKKKQKKNPHRKGELVAVRPVNEVEVLPPTSGVVGKFLENTENLLKARAMRMNGLLKRIDDSGKRTEALLRTAAERMEAAEAKLGQDFVREGLLPEPDEEDEDSTFPDLD